MCSRIQTGKRTDRRADRDTTLPSSERGERLRVEIVNAARFGPFMMRPASCIEVSDQWRFHAGAGGSTGPSKLWLAPSPNLAVLLTRCGQLILREISKFDAIRSQPPSCI